MAQEKEKPVIKEGVKQRVSRKVKELWNIDSIIDVFVDIALLIFDVITSPILIVVRLIRHFFNKWIRDSIKGVLKWIAHWFERKRAYRKEHNYGIFRTYWWLILSSPFIIFGSIILLAMALGFYEGINEAISEDW